MTAPKGKLKGEIQGWLSADPARQTAAQARLAATQAVASCLLLVHRTARPGAHFRWGALADSLRCGPACTGAEQAHGHLQALYFFLGAAAYPRGQIAFLFPPSSALNRPGTFTPFDSGGVCKGYMQRLDGASISAAQGEQLYLEHHSDVAELLDVAADWLAAHFADPVDYVTRPLISEPDAPPLHSLRSRTGHRLAWTIEVQCHQDVPFGEALEVVVARRALYALAPEEWLERMTYVGDPDEPGEDEFDQAVAISLQKRLSS